MWLTQLKLWSEKAQYSIWAYIIVNSKTQTLSIVPQMTYIWIEIKRITLRDHKEHKKWVSFNSWKVQIKISILQHKTTIKIRRGWSN